MIGLTKSPLLRALSRERTRGIYESNRRILRFEIPYVQSICIAFEQLAIEILVPPQTCESCPISEYSDYFNHNFGDKNRGRMSRCR